MFKPKIAFLHNNMQFLNNLFSIVTSPRGNQPPYDPRIGVVINDAKFGVCMRNVFVSV